MPLGAGRGLDATVVPSMLIDRSGFLWVGSREGLFRYDGFQARSFLPDPDLPDRISDVDVRSLYEARDGALWVSTNTGGLNRRDPGTGRFVQFHHDSADPASLSDESVYGVGEDADGNLWVGTQNGLNRLDADGRSFTRFFHERARAGGLAHDWVYAVHLGRSSGRLWIATVGGGIDRWDPAGRRFENFDLARQSGGPRGLNDVFALHESPDGRIWAGTRAGLVVLDPARGAASLFDLSAVNGEQPLVTALHADRQGHLWIATHSQGALRVDPATGAWSRAHPDPPGSPGNLPAQPQLSLATTDAMLFVGTWGGGVYRAPLDAPDFGLLTGDTGAGGLRHKNVTSVLGTRDAGRPWVGSFGGGPERVDVASGGAFASRGSSGDPIRLAGVISLAETIQGELFAGATDGLYRFAPDGRSLGFDTHVEGAPDGIGAGYVGALLADAGGLWVGVGGSGLFYRDAASGRFRSFRHDPARRDSLSGDYVTALAAGDSGRLWVGTRSDGLNLCRIEPWSCERFDGDGASRIRLGHHHITALHRDPSGSLWVATDGGGVSRVVEDAAGRVTGFERWSAARGLLNDGIMSVESDDDGSLWLGTRHGLSRLDPASGRVVNEVAESGLPVSHFNTGASSSDGAYIYMGSVDGLLSMPRGTPLTLRPPAPVRITAFERLAGGAAEALPPSALTEGFEAKFGQVLAVEFGVLDFTETTHEYAYRMKPGDPWTALGQRRQLTFFGLAPGMYEFEVRGRDAFGQWGTSPAVHFAVVPPFWMTFWFRALAVATLLLLASGLHLARMRSLRRRNLVLERLERQRERAFANARQSQRELEEAYAGLRQLTGRLESAKEEERTRISRELHDEFGQTLTAAKINLQMLREASPDPAVARRLEESVAMVDGMIRQARDIALGLRPPLLDEAGLVPALEHHLKLLAVRSGVGIELDAAPGSERIPQALGTTVFRIVQEAVSNALRHAQAKSIRVSLGADAQALELVVEDDGVGFDPGAVQQRVKRGEHLGLLGMTERVKNEGGTIALDARPGAGSRIEVRIPLARPA